MCFYMVVGLLGFEPRIGRLKVCCDNRFTTIPDGPYRQIRTDTSLIKSQVRYR